MPDRTILSSFVLEARRSKKNKNGDSAKRSRFLGIVMKHLSSEPGQNMANAIEDEDLERFKDLWTKATNAIMKDLEEKFKSGKHEKATGTKS